MLNTATTMKKSKNYLLKSTVLSYLERRNYPDTEVTWKPATLSQSVEQMAVSAIVETEAGRSNSILFSCINNDPSQCDHQFSRLVAFIKGIGDETIRNELLGLLCPLLCHMYLEMLRGGQRTPAQVFLKKHSSCLPQRDYSYHQPMDGNLPSALYRPNSLEQLFNSLQNGTIDNETPEKDYMYQILDILGSIFNLSEIETRPMVAAFRSCKYDVKLSQESITLLKKYLGRHSHIILMQVLQTWFHIDVGGAESKECDREDTDLREESRANNGLTECSASVDLTPVCNGHLNCDNELRELQDAIKSVRESSVTLKLFKIDSPDAHVICADMDSNCNLIYAGFRNSEIRIWGVGRHQMKKRPNPNVSRITLSCNIGPNPSITDNNIDSSLGIVLRGHRGPVQDATLIEDADRCGVLVSVSQDSSVRAWRMSDYSCAAMYRGHDYPVWCVDVARHTGYMVTGSHDRTAKLWSLDRTFPVRIFAGHILDVNVVRFHPNGAYVATGGADRSIRMWCVASGRQVRILPGHRAPLRALAFSPDGKYLASAGEDNRIRIWDLTAGSCLQEYKGHQGGVTSLHWSRLSSVTNNSSEQNGALCSAGMDCTVKLWDCQLNKPRSSGHDSWQSSYSAKCSHLVNVRLCNDWVVAFGASS